MGAALRWLARCCARRGDPAADRNGGPRQAILYTRRGCHLCDEARGLLEKHGLEVTEVDIDADATLRARYTDCVPVVLFDGKERFRGRVNEVLLRRLLARHRKGE